MQGGEQGPLQEEVCGGQDRPQRRQRQVILERAATNHSEVWSFTITEKDIFRELPELTDTDSLELLVVGDDTVFTGDQVSRTLEDMEEEEEGWSTVEEGSTTFYGEGDTAYHGQFSTSSIFPEHNFGNYQHFAFWWQVFCHSYNFTWYKCTDTMLLYLMTSVGTGSLADLCMLHGLSSDSSSSTHVPLIRQPSGRRNLCSVYVCVQVYILLWAMVYWLRKMQLKANNIIVSIRLFWNRTGNYGNVWHILHKRLPHSINRELLNPKDQAPRHFYLTFRNIITRQ